MTKSLIHRGESPETSITKRVPNPSGIISPVKEKPSTCEPLVETKKPLSAPSAISISVSLSGSKV